MGEFLVTQVGNQWKTYRLGNPYAYQRVDMCWGGSFASLTLNSAMGSSAGCGTGTVGAGSNVYMVCLLVDGGLAEPRTRWSRA